MGIYLSVSSTKHTGTSWHPAAILWPCQAAAKPPGLQGPRNIKQLQGVNSQLEPLCSAVGSTAAGGKSDHGSSVLLFPVKGAFGGWPVVSFHSTQAHTKLLRGKGQANKPYRLSQILTTGHLLISCQVKCRMFSSCLGPGGGQDTSGRAIHLLMSFPAFTLTLSWVTWFNISTLRWPFLTLQDFSVLSPVIFDFRHEALKSASLLPAAVLMNSTPGKNLTFFGQDRSVVTQTSKSLSVPQQEHKGHCPPHFHLWQQEKKSVELNLSSHHWRA